MMTVVIAVWEDTILEGGWVVSQDEVDDYGQPESSVTISIHASYKQARQSALRDGRERGLMVIEYEGDDGKWKIVPTPQTV